MKIFYIILLLLISLLFSENVSAQTQCHASFYVDSVNSTPFNAVIVNNSVTYLTPPDSAIYSWSFGDGTGSSLRYPTHTYTSPGPKVITLAVTNVNKTCGETFTRTITIDSLGGFHKRTASYNIKIVAPSATGIANSSNPTFVSLVPNLVSQNAIFNFNGLNKNDLVQVDIFSYEGKNVLSFNELLSGNSIQFQTAYLPSGMYFASIKTEGKSALIKFIKQ